MAHSIKTGSGVQFPLGDDVSEMPETCALDVADRHGATLDDVGGWLGVTRERIRQLEVRASRKMHAECRARGISPLNY